MIKNISAILLLACLAQAAVTNLKAEFRGGKTFITFTQDPVTAVRYNIYRSESPITTVTGLSVLVNLGAGSGLDPNFGTYHVIKDLGAPLTSGTGLFVYTPKANKSAYYAITTVTNSTEDKTLTSGVNVLSAAIAEEYWKAPLGVLTQLTDSTSYIYYYWMDYSAWPNGSEYYGNFYHILMDPPVRSMKSVPLYVYLHALNGGDGMPVAVTYGNTYSLRTNDPKNTWWFGSGNDNYTERRVLAYIDAVSNDPRFSVDTNRIYLRGQSMGGKGTLTVGLRNPNRFAALIPFLPPIDTSMTNIMVRNPGHYYPPITDFFGSKDSPEFGMAGHRLLYTTCAQTSNAVWGNWMAVGHQPAGNPTSIVAGSFLRFRKDEMFPAFTHSNKDWNYGLTNPNVYDSVGFINTYIDWTASLHDMNLKNDSLIDSPESLCITVKSPLAGTVVDITPRNIQRFPVAAGNRFNWKSTDVVTDTLVASGTVTADANGLITLKGVELFKTGNHFNIKNVNWNKVSSVPAMAPAQEGIAASPNPFNSSISIRVPAMITVLNIYDLSGKLRARLMASASRNEGSAAFQWNASGFPAGAYIVKAVSGSRIMTRKILLFK